MRIPERISPSPIVDAVVDIRFAPSAPADAVFGLIFPHIKDRYKSLMKLPILQVPDEIRQKDPNFIFQPYYRLEHGPFVLQVGPRVLIFSAPNYPGWGAFSGELRNVMDSMFKICLFDTIDRIGIRFINFFEGNVFKQFDVQLRVGGIEQTETNVFVRTISSTPPFVTTLQISNDVSIQQEDHARHGSIIDLDVSVSTPALPADQLDTFMGIVTNGHDSLKRDFFKLLTPAFLETLHPDYSTKAT